MTPAGNLSAGGRALPAGPVRAGAPQAGAAGAPQCPAGAGLFHAGAGLFHDGAGLFQDGAGLFQAGAGAPQCPDWCGCGLCKRALSQTGNPGHRAGFTPAGNCAAGGCWGAAAANATKQTKACN